MIIQELFCRNSIIYVNSHLNSLPALMSHVESSGMGKGDSTDGKVTTSSIYSIKFVADIRRDTTNQ
ncbi:hypothetical protein MASR1M31_15180 [Porphyromonadaceae bacterium]